MRLKSLLKRLFDKIVQDVLPAGLASILGGLLLTHFNADRVPQPTTVKVMPASPEMMQMLRDEHGLMVDFAKEQAASEKGRGSADQVGRSEPVEASAAPPAQVIATPPLPRPMSVVALAAPKPPIPRSKNPAVSASLPAAAPSQPAAPAPLPAPQQAPQQVPQPAARTDDSLLAKTIGIKDHVVSATQRAVSATIGVIPSWFGSLGDRIGGDGQSPRPPANMVSASWIMPSAAER